MNDWPLAFHFTCGTYGTRLHGHPDGTVDRKHNAVGEPIVGRNHEWECTEMRLLRFPAVLLSDPQRHAVELVVPKVCARGGWLFHIAAAQPNHIHVLLSARVEGKAVRRWLKAWIGQELTARWPLADGTTWWSECGSVKWVWTQDYYERCYEYIRAQQAVAA